MCDCLTPLISSWRILWHHIFDRFAHRSLIIPVEHQTFLNAVNWGPQMHLCGVSRSDARRNPAGVSMPAEEHFANDSSNKLLLMKTKHQKNLDSVGGCKRRKLQGKESLIEFDRYSTCEPRGIASLFTKQGQKGINQDVMLMIEDFASLSGTVFCGVFDGHGPHGHLVAQNVGDILPKKLMYCWNSLYEAAKIPEVLSDEALDLIEDCLQDSDLIRFWKDSLIRAYDLMDEDLLRNNSMDCVTSGTTAVTLVKQGNDLIVGNVGDSRAVLGTLGDDGSLTAVQLTVDLKPDIPSEAERIRRLNGRVFALRSEPSVKRVWLPHHNAPGLAMSRALGDYCLKNYGIISEPEITHRRLTNNDKFVVLATDGVWDVLSNEEVVELVASVPVRSSAGKVVVDAAIHAWKQNYATSKVDDCAVICLFFDDTVGSPE